MASRKEQKEQARLRRLAEERARAERARRARRLRMIAGVVAIVVVLVGVGIAIDSSGGAGGLQHGSKATRTSAIVAALLSGIPESGNILGNPDAPVTMVYYGDLECPICQDFTLNGGFSQLVANEVRQGKVKVEYRAFETATRDPTTFATQQAAALAAGEQGKFWYFAELFYHEQGQEDTPYVTPSYLLGLAQQVPGLNISEWQSQRTSNSLVQDVASQEQEGQTAGVNGTPTLVFTGPKGTSAPSITSEPPYPYSQLKQVVAKVS